MHSIDNKYVASLESRIDHLETELTQLDELLRKVGFDEGIATLKYTAEELIREDAEAKIVRGFEE